MIWVELNQNIKGVGEKGRYGYLQAYNFGDEENIGNGNKEVWVKFDGNVNGKKLPLWCLKRTYNRNAFIDIKRILGVHGKDEEIKKICIKFNL